MFGLTHTYRKDQQFFARLALCIALFTVAAFLQWSLRGYSHVTAAPLTVHLHALAMLGWLGVYIAQNHLAGIGKIANHRKLGWAAVGLATIIVGLGFQITVQAITIHRVPPIFTTPYFLLLGPMHLVFFAAVLTFAIAMRRDMESHRRLMLVATVVLLEPAFGRVIPLSVAMSPWGGWLEGVLQAGVLGIAMLHDRRVRGAVHPALWWGIVVIFACKLVIALLSNAAPVIAYAEELARTR